MSHDLTVRSHQPGKAMDLRQRQWEKLRNLLLRTTKTENFNSRRFREKGVDPSALNSLEEFVARVPFTGKADLLADRLNHPPFGTNFTEPLERYTRFCP